MAWSLAWSYSFVQVVCSAVSILRGEQIKNQWFGIWTADQWIWQLGFQDNNLSVVETVMPAELFLILQLVQSPLNVFDRYVWWKNKNDFSIKASYERILDVGICNWVVDVECANTLNRLWKTKASSKMLIFGWSLILNRLLTRMELEVRGVIVGPIDFVCPLCFGEEEDFDYLFEECPILKLSGIRPVIGFKLIFQISRVLSFLFVSLGVLYKVRF